MFGLLLSGLRSVTEYSGVQLVSCDLAVEYGFDVAATFAGDRSVSGPFLDCLRRQAKQVAQRGLTAGEADGFGDSGFHGCNLKWFLQP